MKLNELNKHIANLGKLFPSAMLRTTMDFYGTDEKDGGLWTSFGEDGTVDYYGYDNSGYGMYIEPKLLKYLKKNGLSLEPYDAGTIMIYDD